MDIDDSQNSKWREGTIFIPVSYIHPFGNVETITYIYTSIYLLFFIAAHVVFRLFLDEIYPFNAWCYPQFPCHLVTFTAEIFNGKLHFLWSVTYLLTKKQNKLLW